MVRKRKTLKGSLSIQEGVRLVYGRLLGRVGIGERDGKHADVLLGYKVGVEMRQAHQSCSHDRQKQT